MIFRDAVLHPREGDSEKIVKLHAAQALDYQLPALGQPNIFTKVVLDRDGRIDLAILGRLTAEAYLIVGNNWPSPEEKYQAICEASNLAIMQGKIEGLTDACVWVPPQIEKTFGRRMRRMGFVKARYVSYFKEF